VAGGTAGFGDKHLEKWWAVSLGFLWIGAHTAPLLGVGAKTGKDDVRVGMGQRAVDLRKPRAHTTNLYKQHAYKRVPALFFFSFLGHGEPEGSEHFVATGKVFERIYYYCYLLLTFIYC
jgi:hypothetical protein